MLMLQQVAEAQLGTSSFHSAQSIGATRKNSTEDLTEEAAAESDDNDDDIGPEAVFKEIALL